MASQPFLKRVVLKNHRRIAACDVHLRKLTFLVGPNGAGKSNFLDALRDRLYTAGELLRYNQLAPDP